MNSRKILVYLPSPLGDAVLCTPALRAIRQKYSDSSVCFIASNTVRQILSPCAFNDEWIDSGASALKLAGKIRRGKFTDVVLFKNSFSAAFTVFLAGVENRIGYRRDGRGFMLTQKIEPLRESDGKFTVASMVDYYLKITEVMGCEVSERKLELAVDEADVNSACEKVPEVSGSGPFVILVPGGAFGLSKCWPAERFAETAVQLREKYNATVLVSVAPVKAEMEIADQICNRAGESAMSLAGRELSLGELKAVFSKAELVITNDTGPRHVAIALGKKLVTLFGPNDPEWTNTGYAGEIQIVGTGPCVPCSKPECFQQEHICMESITVDMVMEAANKLLEN